MMFGVRVAFNPAGAGWITIDYCAGPERVWQELLLSMVRSILETVPETVTESELHDLFPVQRVKPMFNDPECLRALTELTLAAQTE